MVAGAGDHSRLLALLSLPKRFTSGNKRAVSVDLCLRPCTSRTHKFPPLHLHALYVTWGFPNAMLHLTFTFATANQCEHLKSLQACWVAPHHEIWHSEAYCVMLGAGMLRMDGIMQGRCRIFDTPGVPHEHQLSSRLTPDEVSVMLPGFHTCSPSIGITLLRLGVSGRTLGTGVHAA